MKKQYCAPELRRLGGPGEWPRITLVTAVYNGAEYLEATMRSVLSQGYPNLEYIVVDGGSRDGTVEIIREYERELTAWVSEPDQGMYDALNKGFARGSGEVMGWLNASDLLHVNGLFVIGGLFGAFPKVEWITGRPTWLNEEGMVYQVGQVPRWSRIRYLAGANKYVQQESTFWRKSLWERAGGYVETQRGPVGDFDLWVRFFRHAQLYSVDALVGSYRMHRNSLGRANLAECHRVHDQIVEQELARMPEGKWVRVFRRLARRAMHMRGVRYAWWKLVETPIYRWKGPDWAPVLRYNLDRGWLMDK